MSDFRNNKATIPFWSVDEFLYFTMPRNFEKIWSSELLSRVSTFVDAYILYDKVLLPERYSIEDKIKSLDPGGDIFEYVTSEELLHSDELTKGISLDLSLNINCFEELEAENYMWFSQHSGYSSEDNYLDIVNKTNISFSLLRIWQVSLLNEIADLTGSVSILPLSLQGVDTSPSRSLPFHVERIGELSDHFQDNVRTVSAAIGDQYHDYVENVPPFFTLLIDQALSNEHVVETLVQLRRDFKKLRETGAEYSQLIKVEKGLRGKREIVEQWNSSWELLYRGDFKKPQLLKRKISSSDFSKAVVKPGASGLSSIIQSFFEYREEAESYNRFRIYGELYNELDNVTGIKSQLKKKFSFDLSNIL